MTVESDDIMANSEVQYARNISCKIVKFDKNLFSLIKICFASYERQNEFLLCSVLYGQINNIFFFCILSISCFLFSRLSINGMN